MCMLEYKAELTNQLKEAEEERLRQREKKVKMAWINSRLKGTSAVVRKSITISFFTTPVEPFTQGSNLGVLLRMY